MKNNFLDKNELIKEAIHNFKTEPTAETYGGIIEIIRERMAEDGHFLLPVWIPEDNDEENPSYCFHQLQTGDGCSYLVAFTDEEEMKKGPESAILSNFMDVFFDMVFSSAHAGGFILNPWSDESFTFDKTLMQMILNEKDMEKDPEKSNALLEKAIRFATEKHAGGVRKGTTTPYIVHPMEVMSILMRMDADNDLMMAGLLHDTLEDTETTYSELKENFGTDVAALVAAHTKLEGASWQAAREKMIEDMNVASFREKMLVMADMTSNLRSLLRDYRVIGDELWERFNAPKEKQAWYYSKMQDTLEVMQEYRETGAVYWEMVGLYKDLFVEYYVEENWDYIYQISADGTGYAFSREHLTWEPFDGEVKGQSMSRYDAERLEDSWKAHR